MAATLKKPAISIIGGTQAGIRVLSQILKNNNILDKVTIRLFEPNSQFYYSDLLPYMSTNHVTSFKSQRSIQDVLPQEVNFVREIPSQIDPQTQTLVMESGEKYEYDCLVISALSQNDYSKIKGLKKALEDPNTPVTCSDEYDAAIKLQNHLNSFKGGKLQFYLPKSRRNNYLDSISTINLTLEYLMNKSPNFHLLFKTDIIAQGQLPEKFINEYESLGALANFRKVFGINEYESFTLREINSDKQVAVYEDESSNKTQRLPFDLLHLSPEKTLPEFLKSLPRENDKYLEVDKKSLKVKGFENIWSLGYCADLGSTNFSNLSTQADVISENLINSILHKGKLLNKEYNEKPLSQFYGGKQRILDSNEDFDSDSWKSSLNYYNYIFVDPIKYKLFL